MKISITMTHCSRPNYSRQSLESICRAVVFAREVEFAAAVLHIEPGNEEVADECRSISDRLRSRMPVYVKVNRRRLGVNRNTCAAITEGFRRGAHFVVHVEDDILLAEDAFLYFAWAARQPHATPEALEHLPERQVLAVTAYNREFTMPKRKHHGSVCSRLWFHPWGWGLWPESWNFLMRQLWPEKPGTWDQQVLSLMMRYGYTELYPVLSRSQNIGHHSSLHHGYSPEWFAEHHSVRYWGGQLKPGTVQHAVEAAGGFAYTGLRQGATPEARAKRAL